MKAARLRGPRDLRIEDVPVPEIGPDEILLKVRAAHICGTDLRMYEHGARGATAGTPLIPGHEIGGTIERVGAAVAGYGQGMSVAVAPNMGCGTCDLCAGGNAQMCRASRALGVTMDGAFAEYMKVPAAAVAQGNVCPIPDGVSFAAAAMAEPLSCVYNSYERSTLRPGETVLVIGAGPIGLMHARVYLMAGAARVIVNDVSEERLALCREKEPRVMTVASEGLDAGIGELTGGQGVDVCITACAAPAAQQKAFDLAAINGRVIFFGGLPAGREVVALNTNHIHYKQLTVTGTTRQSLAQYRRVLRLIAAGLIAVDDLVTDVGPLASLTEAYRRVAAGSGLKHGVVWS